MQNIILRPFITEKSMQNAKNSRFTFMVATVANKNEIRYEVQKQFGVKVKAVVTSFVKGRSKRIGKNRLEKSIAPVKKAVVTLEKGQKIDIFELGG